MMSAEATGPISEREARSRQYGAFRIAYRVGNCIRREGTGLFWNETEATEAADKQGSAWIEHENPHTGKWSIW